MRKSAGQIVNEVLKGGKKYDVADTEKLAKQLAGCADHSLVSKLTTAFQVAVKDGTLHEFWEGGKIVGYQATAAYEKSLNDATEVTASRINTNMRVFA